MAGSVSSSCIHSYIITLRSSRASSSVSSRPFAPFAPILPRHHCSPLCFRPRNSTGSAITSPKNNKSVKKKNRKQKLPSESIVKDDDLDEDAFEALFSQLEEDLKNDGLSLDDLDDELSEADLAQLDLELAEALGDDELLGSSGSLPDQEVSDDAEENDDEDEDEDDEEEDEEEEEDLPNLKTWQLRRLAHALKDGKRKTSIKNLAADVCLDRSLVLKLLRDPPPNLLLMSAALPDKPAPVISESEQKPEQESTEIVSLETALEDLPEPEPEPEPDPSVKTPVHVTQSNWSAHKRLKKVQLNTLERVYKRTKRPTNTVISSIVHVTNLPRKKVVKWFEDRRAEDGVPDQRRPYQREADATESVLN